jgi:hypothetical protein
MSRATLLHEADKYRASRSKACNVPRTGQGRAGFPAGRWPRRALSALVMRFDMAVDVTASELRVELLPAYEESEAYVRQVAAR